MGYSHLVEPSMEKDNIPSILRKGNFFRWNMFLQAKYHGQGCNSNPYLYFPCILDVHIGLVATEVLQE